MISFKIPQEKKMRVILDTDAQNEVDDQFAIAQAVLTESFDLRGMIAAYFGRERSMHSMQDSYDDIPVDSEGARFIIRTTFGAFDCEKEYHSHMDRRKRLAHGWLGI